MRPLSRLLLGCWIAASVALAGSASAIGQIDPAGVATAVSLREAYGEPKKKLGDPWQFYDLSYYRAAIKTAP